MKSLSPIQQVYLNYNEYMFPIRVHVPNKSLFQSEIRVQMDFNTIEGSRNAFERGLKRNYKP